MEQALDRIGTRVYRPNYVTAAELQTLITPLLTEKIGVVSVSTPAEAGIATNDSSAGGDKFAGGDVLVVRDYEAVLAQIDQMVAEVDVRPLQVAIEAMILSVKLKDTDKFGVNFQLLREKPNIKLRPGLARHDIWRTCKFENGGLKFGFLDSNLGAFLDALETIGDTNVIANAAADGAEQAAGRNPDRRDRRATSARPSPRPAPRRASSSSTSGPSCGCGRSSPATA